MRKVLRTPPPAEVLIMAYLILRMRPWSQSMRICRLSEVATSKKEPMFRKNGTVKGVQLPGASGPAWQGQQHETGEAVDMELAARATERWRCMR